MSVLKELRAEHRDLESRVQELLNLAERGIPEFESRAVSFFRAFYAHAVREEKELIAPLKAMGRVGGAYVTELFGDHKFLYHELGVQLRNAMMQKDNQANMIAATRQLAAYLRAHFRKEENLLYQIAERTMGETKRP